MAQCLTVSSKSRRTGATPGHPTPAGARVFECVIPGGVSARVELSGAPAIGPAIRGPQGVDDAARVARRRETEASKVLAQYRLPSA